MFNRNPNVSKRQFAMVDDLDAVPSSTPTHASGESIPFAGGSFNVRQNLAEHHGARLDVGTFITQSAQTVIPGTLSRGEHYSEFNSTPEQEVAAANFDESIGVTEERLSDGSREIYAAVGYNESPVGPEGLGTYVREQRAKAKEKRQEEDGGVAGFTMREWNALDDEGMTRRHFE
jgi:hypothetical protein